MFRIGDFSRIARVSARLLRFYDELGLFVPAHADSQTGYRYYTVAQLAELNRILVLKDLGFTLDQVREIVRADVSAAELRKMLLLRRNDVEQSLAAEAQRLRQIETRIAQLEADGALSADDVMVRAEPAREILSLRRTVSSFAAARTLILELRQQAGPVLPRSPLTLLAVAHSAHFEHDEIDVEFGFVLPADSTLEAPRGTSLIRRTLEAVPRMAVCVRVGLPEDAHLVTAKVGKFLEAGGEVLAGPSREVFLRPPDPQRMHESVVEMQFSIAAPPEGHPRGVSTVR
jgi:DNA-binding transcriptional MerR regulator